MLIENPKQRGILIVDDDKGIRKLVSEYLVRQGYEHICRAHQWYGCSGSLGAA